MHSYTCNCGTLFQQRKRVIVTKPISYMPYASAGVLIHGVACDNGDIEERMTLVSYETEILELVDIYKFGGGVKHVLRIIEMVYTNTTIKHVIAFLREYCEGITYRDIKKMDTTAAHHVPGTQLIIELDLDTLNYDIITADKTITLAF